VAFFAAENTARVCRGVEFDPRYVDVIIRRYQASTGPPPH
jgi:DNA modification methylase